VSLRAALPVVVFPVCSLVWALREHGALGNVFERRRFSLTVCHWRCHQSWGRCGQGQVSNAFRKNTHPGFHQSNGLELFAVGGVAKPTYGPAQGACPQVKCQSIGHGRLGECDGCHETLPLLQRVEKRDSPGGEETPPGGQTRGFATATPSPSNSTPSPAKRAREKPPSPLGETSPPEATKKTAPSPLGERAAWVHTHRRSQA